MTAAWRWVDRGLLVAAAEGAVTLVAEKVTAEAKRSAPRRTGSLAQSYRYRLVNNPSGGRRAVAVVETDVFYAIFAEFGTSEVAAQPHLGPAVEAARRLYGG